MVCQSLLVQRLLLETCRDLRSSGDLMNRPEESNNAIFLGTFCLQDVDFRAIPVALEHHCADDRSLLASS